jgi:glutamate racemase
VSVSDAPIGVFDSGLGGLTVVREMLGRMPGERLVYIGDSGHAPYGAHTEEEIRAYSMGQARFLLDRYGCRGIVIACNTATAAAAEYLRANLSVPVVGMEPAVKPSVAVTRTGKVGILATVGTLSSARFAALLTRYDANGAVNFITQPCPGLPEAVEEGRTDTPETRALVEQYVRPLLEQGADTLVLGCTHYPVLRPLIAEIAGPDVALIDTGDAVARRAVAVFDTAPNREGAASLLLYTTGNLDAFGRGAAAILGDAPFSPSKRLHWVGDTLSEAT